MQRHNETFTPPIWEYPSVKYKVKEADQIGGQTIPSAYEKLVLASVFSTFQLFNSIVNLSQFNRHIKFIKRYNNIISNKSFKFITHIYVCIQKVVFGITQFLEIVIKIFYMKWAIWCLRFGTFSNRALHCLFVPLIISQSPSSHSFAVVYEIMTWMIMIHIEITWWYHMGNQHARLHSHVCVDMGYCIPVRWNESEFCIADDWWEHILLHIQTQNTTGNGIKINKWYGVLPQLAHAILYELTLCQRCFYRRVFFENAGLNLLPRASLFMMTSSNGNIFPLPVNSPQKGQRRGALMFSLICVWINGWVNNREAGDLRRHRAHYDVIVMCEVYILK